MAENLMVGSHKTSNAAYRAGWDRLFGPVPHSCHNCRYEMRGVFQDPCKACVYLGIDCWEAKEETMPTEIVREYLQDKIPAMCTCQPEWNQDPACTCGSTLSGHFHSVSYPEGAILTSVDGRDTYKVRTDGSIVHVEL